MERIIRFFSELLTDFDQKLTLEQEHTFVKINYVFFQISNKGWNKYPKKLRILADISKNNQRHIFYEY